MKKIVLLLVLLAVSSVATAASKRKVKLKAFGTDTREWMALQRESATRNPPRPMAGEVADQVYQRYLKSFSHPIPEQFRRDRFVEGGGGR